MYCFTAMDDQSGISHEVTDFLSAYIQEVTEAS